jgi:hypothetical protein
VREISRRRTYGLSAKSPTDDKIYCVYVAPGEAIIEEHARRGGFPANRISKVSTVIDPSTEEVFAREPIGSFRRDLA